MRRKLSIVAAVAGLLIGTTALGYAQSSTQDHAPGQRMQERGSVPGHPGASGYAPGQRMHERGSKAGQPGASGYAPGRQTPETTGRSRSRRRPLTTAAVTFERRGRSRHAVARFVWLA
jgi:hypothetical protein